MILIGYDGSDDARAAVEHAGGLLDGEQATVLTVWEPFSIVLEHASYGLGMTGGVTNGEEMDLATQDAAEVEAQAGAALAREAGFDAHPMTRPQVSTVAQAILDAATEFDAKAIVVGSRGLTGLKSLLLGSVSHGVMQHADRAVIVVPSEKVAVARAKQAADGQKIPAVASGDSSWAPQ